MTPCHVVARSVETARLCWMLIHLEGRNSGSRGFVSIRTPLLGTVLVSPVSEEEI